ncbi:substrate-binding periplasmic protein [Aliikangiella marina]|uniref:substrate-binding periplasmic protein n=1 Tax=Aliikangiella marina TaxID=1712262 RepID=UPI00163D6FB7|nr:transporter substrate-binding domain-containing protein [Aliikangiella marina]
MLIFCWSGITHSTAFESAVGIDSMAPVDSMVSPGFSIPPSSTVLPGSIVSLGAVVLLGAQSSIDSEPKDSLNLSSRENPDSAIQVGFHRSVPAALDRGEIRWTGFYGTIYQCLFENMQGNFSSNDMSFQNLPVRRMTKMLESGKLDVGILLARTDVRDEHSTFIGPFIEHPYILLTKKDTPIKANEDWSQWTLGTVYGTNFHHLLSNFTKAKIETASSWDSITGMLLRNRVEGVVIAREIVEKNISPQLLIGLKRTELVNLPSMKIGLYVSNLSPQKNKLTSEFYRAIDECHSLFLIKK